MKSTIERRLLVNYRVDPERLFRLIPSGLAPQLVDGKAIVGICLIRLGDVRPLGMPASVGVTMENAAHRIAVERVTDSGTETGVYVPRRDTSSRLAALVGGRVFPGVHQRAYFDVREVADSFSIEMVSKDGSQRVSVDAEVDSRANGDSVFKSLDDASEFFKSSPAGYSPSYKDGHLDSVTLNTPEWSIEPVKVTKLKSSFYEDAQRFPRGGVEFDSAFVMRNIAAIWDGDIAEVPLPRKL